MAYSITDKCIGCHACAIVCPQQAIIKPSDGGHQFAIHAKRCNECDGIYDHPQCASICPVEEAILDSQHNAVNPCGSLAGTHTAQCPQNPNTDR